MSIVAIENLGVTEDAHESIDFSDNEIIRLENFPSLKTLQCLFFNNNRISKVAGDLGTVLPKLNSLILANNKISSVIDLAPLASLGGSLTHLVLLGNPVIATCKNYRVLVAAMLPRLTVLDFSRITAEERKEAKEVAAAVKKGKQGYEEFAILAGPTAGAGPSAMVDEDKGAQIGAAGAAGASSAAAAAAAAAAAGAAAAGGAGQAAAAAAGGPSKGAGTPLTPETRALLKQRIQAAKSMDALKQLGAILKSGVLPEGFVL